MSSGLEIKVISGFYKDKVGTVEGKIPGGNFFKVQFNDGSLTALHVSEFERIPNETVLHNELTNKPLRGKNGKQQHYCNANHVRNARLTEQSR